MTNILLLILLKLLTRAEASINVPPNIVIIMADDLGWNDVSFHGSDQILTPNIDTLAYHGVTLNRFYTPPMCTPSRSSFLTGKYSHRIGMQHYVIPNDGAFGLDLNQKIIPQYLKEAGYKTHLIGKWHQGFYQRQYTPTERGFDSFFGYYGGYIDYFDYSLKMFERNYSRGYDMRRNLTVNYDIPKGTYATNLFTSEAVRTIQNHNYQDPLFLLLSHLAPHAGNQDNPMQAPQSEIDKFSYIRDPKRRTLAAMISLLDRGVGEVVEALEHKNVLKNTIILFYSDNGGPTLGLHSTSTSNYPLRGQKNSPWEGGLRNIALVYSPLLQNKSRVSNELIHVTDLLPTLLHLSGIEIPEEIDGVSQWETINEGKPTTRKEIVHIIDPIFQFSSYTQNNFKVLNGSSVQGKFDSWLGDTEKIEVQFDEYYNQISSSLSALSIQKHENTLSKNLVFSLRKNAIVNCKNIESPCNPLKNPCLFDVYEDPCEQNNLAETNIEIMATLMNHLKNHNTKSVAPLYKTNDPNCDPAKFNYTWNWWEPDSDNLKGSSKRYSPFSNLIVFSTILTYSIRVN